MKDVTVLMTTFNEKDSFISKAIKSILNQTYKNINFLIIIDNPNNSNAIKIIEEYAYIDNRIHYIINDRNIGLAQSLNKGIGLIDTKYICRMDADDIALPDRIEKQVNFLKKNPEIDLLGCNTLYIDQYDNIIGQANDIFEEHNYIKEAMKYINVFKHPTLIGKTDVFRKIKYRNLNYAQDYDFTCRVIENNYNVHNIKEKLLKYRLGKNIDKKIIYQEIIAKLVREHYKKSNLSKYDIEKTMIEIMKNDIDYSIVKAKNDIELIVENIKNKKIYLSCKELMICCFRSKYHRERILNLFLYSALVLKYRLLKS